MPSFKTVSNLSGRNLFLTPYAYGSDSQYVLPYTIGDSYFFIGKIELPQQKKTAICVVCHFECSRAHPRCRFLHMVVSIFLIFFNANRYIPTLMPAIL